MKNNTNDKEKVNNAEMKVLIGMPSEVRIDLVQANELKHYELFQWLVTLLLPIAVGFWTAYFTGIKNLELLWSASAFTAISILFAILAFIYRKKVFRESIKKIAHLDSFKNVVNKNSKN